MDINLILKLILFFVFVLLSTSLFLILRIDVPRVNVSRLKSLKKEDGYKRLERTFQRLTVKKLTMYDEVKRFQKKKAPGGLSKFLYDLRLALSLEKKMYALGRFLFSVVFFASLAIIISLLLNNLMLLVPLSIFFMMIPIFFKVFRYYTRRREINIDLEGALSLITTSYMQNNNIILAVKENINYINEPIRTIFLAFLHDSSFVYEDTKKSLSKMKLKLDSAVFHEWVDAMIECLYDKDLKTTLIPIVHKLSDMRIIANELDTIVYNPLKEFMIVVAFYFLSIPLIFFLNRSWFNTIVNTSVGRVYVAISVMVIIFSVLAVINLTRPVEYKR